MYSPKALKLYYGLISFLLMMAFFVLSPISDRTVADFKGAVKTQIRVGLIQTVGDQPWFLDLAFIYDSVDTFYIKSADAYIELVSNVDADTDLVYIVKETYYRLGFAAKPIVEEEQLIVSNGPRFMEEPGIANIVPAEWIGYRGQGLGNSIGLRPNEVSGEVNTLNSKFQIPTSASKGSVAGATFDPSAWVEVKDAITGKLYCLAIYGGEINKYLGECARDYH